MKYISLNKKLCLFYRYDIIHFKKRCTNHNCTNRKRGLFIYFDSDGNHSCCSAISPYWSIIPGVLTLFVTFFFRNPKRTVPNDPALIISPADGKIINIEEIFEDNFFYDTAIKITIFLSIFDVYINRSPVAGKITLQQYTSGRFKLAYKKSAPFQNERHTIGLETGTIKILVTQIAGIIAHRIIPGLLWALNYNKANATA